MLWLWVVTCPRDAALAVLGKACNGAVQMHGLMCLSMVDRVCCRDW